MGCPHGGADNLDGHDDDGLSRCHGAREELDGVNPAKIEDPVHGSLGLLRARELGQARGQQIEGATVHGDEAPTGQHDLWTRDLSALDPSSQGERIRGQGAGVDHADDSPARQHGAQGGRQLCGRHRFGRPPLRFREVHVRVPEAGGDGEAGAIEHGRPRGNANAVARAHRCDEAIGGDDRSVCDGRLGGRGIDPGSEDAEHVAALGSARAARGRPATADGGQAEGDDALERGSPRMRH